ncbi:MAG: hypothetical protein A2428_02550 [Bdellovibrionales bacterium RIFOXYC1_FULL_54_43]|nr:MAG: hypothetical protein A2428_02550 [Bdellovibrionales bacterium RIFOXYC1_FULL_54_43]
MRRSSSVTLLMTTLIFFSAQAAMAESGQKMDWGNWAEARALYDSGKPEEALRAFLNHPDPENASYYYNLGTLSFRLGRIGAALAYFEKANRLRPHDPSIQHNLQLARSTLGKAIGDEKLDRASNSLESLADRVPLDEVRGTFGLLCFILALIWLRSYLKIRELRKTLLQPAALFGLLGVAITGSLYGAQRLAEIHPPSVCLEGESIRSGPGSHFIELAQVEPGMKLRLLGPSSEAAGGSDAAGVAPAATLAQASPTAVASPGASAESPKPVSQPVLWVQVRYSPDGIGWIRASSLLLL